MNAQNYLLYHFLNLCGGSWRNSVYIYCSVCPYKTENCGGYLLVCNAEGAPVLFGVKLMEKISGAVIDKSECVGSISRKTFESLFERWLAWNTDNPKECSIMQIINKSN